MPHFFIGIIIIVIFNIFVIPTAKQNNPVFELNGIYYD